MVSLVAINADHAPEIDQTSIFNGLDLAPDLLPGFFVHSFGLEYG